MAPVRVSQKLSPCPTEPRPANSKTDRPLAKAKPVSNGGSTYGITDLRRKENDSAEKTAARVSNSSADTKVTGEGGDGGAAGGRSEFPLQPVMKSMMRQLGP